MTLPEEAIIEFQEIFKKVYGKEISHDEASLRANNLVSLYRVVYTDWADRWMPDKDKKLKDRPSN